MPVRFRNSRARGWLSSKSSGANAAENVAMELAHQERFQGTPQETGAQVRAVTRNQHNVARIAAGMDLIRTAMREDATFNPQTLLNDLELQQCRWFNRGDSLEQIPSSVPAAHCCPNVILVAFGSDWLGQQGAKKERRAPGNFLKKHEVTPDCFRAGVEVKPRRDGFAHPFAREEQTHESIPSSSMVPRPECCRHRFRRLHFGFPADDQSTLPR